MGKLPDLNDLHVNVALNIADTKHRRALRALLDELDQAEGTARKDEAVHELGQPVNIREVRINLTGDGCICGLSPVHDENCPVVIRARQHIAENNPCGSTAPSIVKLDPHPHIANPGNPFAATVPAPMASSNCTCGAVDVDNAPHRADCPAYVGGHY